MSFIPQFPAPISREIWENKYRYQPLNENGQKHSGSDEDLASTFLRVAKAVAAVEKKNKRSEDFWTEKFYEAMADFSFLPAGRILAGAGTHRKVTLFNCFVMGTIEDDLGSIFENLKEAALTMQQGGGIGQDFSTLRPRGALVQSIGADASGPVSYMRVWDSMCQTIMSAGTRRGAMMATLRCDHPDIEAFIDIKSDPNQLRNFNLSVLITDAFMEAVKKGAKWPLIFNKTIFRIVSAQDLWQRIMRANYNYAEPGVIFIDRVNRENNLHYLESISATNPCGEQPLPPYGACLLGSLNLTKFIKKPFSREAKIDFKRIEEITQIAIRFLDNVISISRFPLKAQKKEALSKRRIGLGITGLADALIMLGIPYNSVIAEKFSQDLMKTISHAAYLESCHLSREKGSFPLFRETHFLKSPNIQRQDKLVRKEISKHGIRNGCLTSIAPTGTISLFAGNVSSGIEPVFNFHTRRRIVDKSGATHEEILQDYIYARYISEFGEDKNLPKYFITMNDLKPQDHLRIQAAVQPYIDSSISKTINCPSDLPFEDFTSIYEEAYRLGLKGCTTFRPNPITGAVLTPLDIPPPHQENPKLQTTKTKIENFPITNNQKPRSIDIAHICPRCGLPKLLKIGSCWMCQSCGFSSCG
ncbi:MAG: adenosylcobalamin-dependent ribonucleoside-diphosphate reductase [Hyphomicrobium sp.]